MAVELRPDWNGQSEDSIVDGEGAGLCRKDFAEPDLPRAVTEACERDAPTDRKTDRQGGRQAREARRRANGQREDIRQSARRHVTTRSDAKVGRGSGARVGRRKSRASPGNRDGKTNRGAGLDPSLNGASEKKSASNEGRRDSAGGGFSPKGEAPERAGEKKIVPQSGGPRRKEDAPRGGHRHGHERHERIRKSASVRGTQRTGSGTMA